MIKWPPVMVPFSDSFDSIYSDKQLFLDAISFIIRTSSPLSNNISNTSTFTEAVENSTTSSCLSTASPRKSIFRNTVSSINITLTPITPIPETSSTAIDESINRKMISLTSHPNISNITNDSYISSEVSYPVNDTSYISHKGYNGAIEVYNSDAIKLVQNTAKMLTRADQHLEATVEVL